MKRLLLFLFLMLTVDLDADLYKWSVKCLVDNQVYQTSGYQELPPTVCPKNEAHGIATDSISIFDTQVIDSSPRDSFGRLETAPYSANPTFQAQWTGYSDYINIATPTLNKRGFGPEMCWSSATSTYHMSPASDTLPTAPKIDDDSYSAYHQNALDHHVFPGQRPISPGWERVRLRYRFIDTVNIRSGLVRFSNAVSCKTKISSYIFLRNLGVNGEGNQVTPFNPASPTNDIDNPAGFIIVKYVDGVGISGDGVEEFSSEKSSQDLEFFENTYGVPLLELWIEIDYDATNSEIQTNTFSGTVRSWIFRPFTVSH